MSDEACIGIITLVALLGLLLGCLQEWLSSRKKK